MSGPQGQPGWGGQDPAGPHHRPAPQGPAQQEGHPHQGAPSPGYGQPAYGQPAAYGQPPYGQPWYGQPGYGPPPGYGQPAPPVPPSAPRAGTVTSGVFAFAAAALVGLTATVVTLLNRDAYVDQAVERIGLDPTEFGGDVGEALARSVTSVWITVGAVASLLGVALLTTMVLFAWRGHNWARITLWAVGGVGLLGIVTAFGAPLAVITVLGVLQFLLLAAGIVLLALRPSNDWFTTVGRRRRAGLPA